MGWLIRRVFFISLMVGGLSLGATLALSLVYEGALTFNAPSWRILNGIILVGALLALLQSTVKTCLSLWLDHTDTNLRVTGLLDGAVVRFLVTAYVLVPHTKTFEPLGKLSSFLSSHDVTIQTERQWFITSSWGETLFDGGLLLAFIANAVLIALALYIALARFLNLDLPTNWTLRRFDLAYAEQTRIERDKLRDKVQTIEAESAALRENLKSAEKEIVTLNMKLVECDGTAKVQKQESIRLGNELERYQIKFKEIADHLPKIEADRDASVQTIYKLSEDLRIARDRIEDLEQQVAQLRLQRVASSNDTEDNEDDNPLLTLMAMDRVGVTERVMRSDAPRPSSQSEEVDIHSEQEDLDVEANSVEVDTLAAAADVDKTEPTAAPVSIALSTVDTDTVIHGEVIAGYEPKTNNDVEVDRRAATMPTAPDVRTEAETADVVGLPASDQFVASVLRDDDDTEVADDFEPQEEAISGQEDQPDETFEIAAEIEDSGDEPTPEPKVEMRTKTTAQPDEDPFKDIPFYTHPYREGELERIKDFLQELMDKSANEAANSKAGPTNSTHNDADTNVSETIDTNVIQDVIILAFPFRSAKTNEASHMRNYINYLFSTTGRHPANKDTKWNYVIEDDVKNPLGSYWNTDPRGMAKNYAKRRDDLVQNHEQYLRDGAYVQFIITVDGICYSNFVSGSYHDDNHNVYLEDSELLNDVIDALGGEEAFETTIDRLIDQYGAIVDWAEASCEAREVIEIKCHQKVQEVLGGDAEISISHNDQRDHNSIYHIHRIREREDGEEAQISQEEMDAIAKSWEHIDPKTGKPKGHQ
jgi:hypothetical protein